jgi:trigger factor
VSSKSVGENRTELVVEVKGEIVQEGCRPGFPKNAKKIALPGFRRGKAPRAMNEKMYGKGSVL